MKGTEKQVKYAQDIIENAVAVYKEFAGHIGEMEKSYQEQMDEDMNFVITWLEELDDAAMIINNFKDTCYSEEEKGKVLRDINGYLRKNEIYTVGVRRCNELFRVWKLEQ